MDQWTEVAPVGSNVWIVPRTIYNSVCVCVSNRSPALQSVVVDVSGCENAIPLVASPGGDDQTTIRSLVFPGTTTVVTTLTPASGTKMKVVFSASAQPTGTATSVEIIEDKSQHTVSDSVSQSVEIEGWLKRRAVTRSGSDGL